MGTYLGVRVLAAEAAATGDDARVLVADGPRDAVRAEAAAAVEAREAVLASAHLAFATRAVPAAAGWGGVGGGGARVRARVRAREPRRRPAGPICGARGNGVHGPGHLAAAVAARAPRRATRIMVVCVGVALFVLLS